MFTYNITFVVALEKEPELLDYLRKDLIPRLFNSQTPALEPQIKKIIEAGGEKPGPEHGLSIALSALFETEEAAHLWNDHILIPALGDFNVIFGSHALFFVTLMENLYI